MPALTELLAEYEFQVKGSINRIDVTGLELDSRRCFPGCVYFALAGRKHDGLNYVDEAVARGAQAVILEQFPTHVPRGVAMIRVPDARDAMAYLSRAFYRTNERSMHLVATTGTNGKTSTTAYIEHILSSAIGSAGVVGTGGARLNGEVLPSYSTTYTTPESIELHRQLARMSASGAKAVALEASSVALDVGRLKYLSFAAGVFTNLSPEHLDDHHTVEAYWAAKLKLFEGLCEHAVVNDDEPHAEDIKRRMPGNFTTYGIDSAYADYRATSIVYGRASTEYVLEHASLHTRVIVPTPGRFAVLNSLAAIAATGQLGVRTDDAVYALKSIPGIAGRFEVKADEQRDVAYVVDFAHTPAALQNVLEAAGHIASGRVAVVFGCGGDRDRTKRAAMGEVAAKFADFTVITSDNPRTERPCAIIEEIAVGANRVSGASFVVEELREAAIARAVNWARAGDVVVIAGKGDEDYQDFGSKKLPFSDSSVVSDLIRVNGGGE